MVKQAGINALLYRIDIDTIREYFADEMLVQDIPARLVEEYNKRKRAYLKMMDGHLSMQLNCLTLARNES